MTAMSPATSSGPASSGSEPPGPEGAAQSGGGRPARMWAVMLAACAGQFLVVLDMSVVNVALPSMRTALRMDAAGLQWVVNAYTLTFAGCMLLGGRAADVFGRKRMFLLGLALFTTASLLGGLAQEPGICWPRAASRARVPRYWLPRR